jgi:hypothetical protein
VESNSFVKALAYYFACFEIILMIPQTLFFIPKALAIKLIASL